MHRNSISRVFLIILEAIAKAIMYFANPLIIPLIASSDAGASK